MFYAFIAGLIIGIFFACMCSSGGLGGIDMTDSERSRIIKLITRATQEREATVILWKDGAHLDMVTFPKK